MNIYVYENKALSMLDPISTTRATFDIRIGKDTFLDRIKNIYPNSNIQLFVRDEIKDLVSDYHPDLVVNPEKIESGIWLLGNVLWKEKEIIVDESEQVLFIDQNECIGASLNEVNGLHFLKNLFDGKTLETIKKTKNINGKLCKYLWDILDIINDSLLIEKALYYNNENQKILNFDFDSIHLINESNIFIGKSSIQPGVIMDASLGPIIIDDDVKINAHSYIEGPVYIGEGSVISPLSQIKKSIIGPMCKIGGELNGVIIQGFSNKAHYGHLGDSFIGEWVNLGAGTTNSNLKNNYSNIEILIKNKAIKTNKIHLGCFIGDYVKTAIGTKINTGSIFETGSMIFSKGFPPKNIPILTWLENENISQVDIKKFFISCKRIKERRKISFSDSEKLFFTNLLNKIEK